MTLFPRLGQFLRSPWVRTKRPTPRRRTTKLGLEMLEDRTVPTTISLVNLTGLSPSVGQAWVAGFNGGSSGNGLASVQGSPGQGTFSASTQAFYPIGSGAGQINTITLNSGSGRLIFVVSATQPTALPLGTGSFTPAPYPTAPAVLPSGPQDFFEFGYVANDDLTAVQGFGLNMSFTVPNINGTSVTETYGVNPIFSRAAISNAYSAFMRNDPQGAEFQKLLYPSTSFPGPMGLTVPGNQFFGICDPFDWISNYPSDHLATTYWNDTLNNFFHAGNHLSINLNAGTPSNIYSGSCVGNTYTLSNGINTYMFSHPGTGLAGAQYVFGQANPGSGDQGLLQDTIWQALCRGVALDGVSTMPITSGQSTTAWNNPATWYTPHTSTAFPTFTAAYNTYGKFLHYSTIAGMDSRNGGTPIYLGNAAYAFSEDETPLGPYPGPQVPSKTINNVGPNDTVTITLGAWDSAVPTVTGVQPGTGPMAGGTSMTINGTNFTGATAVMFGDTPAVNFHVISPTMIVATLPAHAAGTVDVTVATPLGISAISTADQFTYAPASATNHFAFVQQPLFTFVNHYFPTTIVVQIVNSQGMSVAQRGERITLSLVSPNGAVLLGVKTRITDATGKALFPRLRVNRPGSYQLRATRTGGDPGTPIDPDTSNVFNIARAAHFTMTVTPPTLANNPIQVTVTYPDSNYRGTVQFLDYHRARNRWFRVTAAQINSLPILNFTYTFNAGDVVGQTVQHTFQLEEPFAGFNLLLVRDLLAHWSGRRVFQVT